jgi:hypothetical protein
VLVATVLLLSAFAGTGAVPDPDSLQTFVGRPASELITALGTDHVRSLDESGATRLRWFWRETVVDTGGRGPPETVISGGAGRPAVTTVPGEYRPPRLNFVECTIIAHVDAAGLVTEVAAMDPGCPRLSGVRVLSR